MHFYQFEKGMEDLAPTLAFDSATFCDTIIDTLTRCINIRIDQVGHSRESGNPERKPGFRSLPRT